MYNDVVVDPNEYIYQLGYKNYAFEWTPMYNYSMYPETWTITYGPRTYGKCFTPVLDPEITKKGLNRIDIRTKGDMRVYIHNPGVFYTEKQKKSFEVYFGTRTTYNVDYELLKLLTFQNETCIDDPTYNRDKCTHKRVYEVIQQVKLE